MRLDNPIKIGDDVIGRTDCTKFLGLWLDDKLNFAHHVSTVGSKVARTLGIMCKLREFLPLRVLKSLYYALIFPYITYSIEVWYGAPKYLKDEIKILQKRVIRCMNFLPYNEHTALYLGRMNMLTVEHLYFSNIALYMYRTLNIEKYDDHLKAKLHSFCDLHDYPTRNRFSLRVPRVNKEKSKSHVHCSGVRIWNSIPDGVKGSTSVTSFKHNLKKFLLGQPTAC